MASAAPKARKHDHPALGLLAAPQPGWAVLAAGWSVIGTGLAWGLSERPEWPVAVVCFALAVREACDVVKYRPANWPAE